MGLGFWGLMFSHSISLVIALCTTAAICLFHWKTVVLDWRKLRRLMLTAAATLLLSIGFWLPMIEQLLSNALKYTTSGGIRIRGLDRDGKGTNAQAVYVVIEDDGIGIRKEDLPRIFERGFTGYNGRYDRKSTGIGLYLCRQIMERLGHTIRAESEIGVGTRVTLGFLQDSM